MYFENKVVMITGAGSGVGESTALHFAKLSAKLALVDINAMTLEKTSDACEKINDVKVLQAAIDISKEEQIESLVQDILKEFGRIDVVVNSAAVVITTKITDSDVLKKYDETMAVNLRAIVAITHFVTPALTESKGCIINISSVGSHIVVEELFPYNIGKVALDHFTKCVALELAPKGIRANYIMPGPLDTNVFVNNGLTLKQSDAIKKKSQNHLPLKRIAAPQEISELIEFLASDKAKSVTGAGYVVDCGQSLIGSMKLLD